MKNKLVLFVLFAWASVAFHAVADDADYSGPRFSLVPLQPVLTAAAQITPDTYSNNDSAIIEQKSVRVYEPDGTGACQDETFTKVLTEKGKRDNREFSMGVMLPYFTVSVPKLEVIKPDGAIIPVDVAANSKQSIDESQMAENIYDPNMQVFAVNIPQLDVGDIVHVVDRQTIHRSIMPEEFDDENILEGSSYIRHWSYEVFAPTNLPLISIGLRDQVPGTVTSTVQTNGATADYHWEVNNVPRMFDEPNMPAYDEVLQRLFVSTVPSWQDISKWNWSLNKPHLDAYTPEMQQKVNDLIAGQSADLDKVKALFHYVSANIQYMGITPETNRPGFEPHDVCLTYKNKYGVCRDKAGLLVEMLRLAGFKAYPTLINIGAKRDQQVPQPDFNHEIVSVELTPGHYTLMDPTDEHSRELLPAQDCNRSYLVSKPEGETLLTSPVPPADKHMLLVKTTGTLDADGTLSATAEFSFDGVNDDAYRNAFSQMRPDEIKRFFEGRLKEAIPDFKLVSLKLTPENMMDITVPLRAELTYTANGLTANGGDKSIVSLPWLAKDLGVVNRVLIDVVGLQKRKYPLDTEVTCGIREEMSLKLTGQFATPLDVPTFASVNDDSIAYDENISVTNGTLSGSREFALKTVEFYPDEYLRLKEALKDMGHDMRKNLIMSLKSSVPEKSVVAKASPEPPVDSDAEILYSHKTFEIKDAHTAVYHVKYSKRILTYNGKIKESAVKINYNPACSDAKILHAVVISSDGTRHEISAVEVNAMDQAWNPGAKRYTGGKVLVASLPGVDVGSVIEVEYEITMHDMPYLSDFESFQFPEALELKTLTVTAPAGLKFSSFISGAPGAISQSKETSNGVASYDWQATNIDALPSELQLPPEWTYDSGVEYFAGNISDYWKALNEAMLMRAQNNTNAAALARQLTASAKTKLEAVKAIRDFVAQNIRDGGPSFTELPLSELSDADATLADGYGHAADRAILLYAMLSAAGFQPGFIMASGLPSIAGINGVARSFPLPDDFQAPLVQIKVDGDDYYLNDTDQYSQLGTTGFNGKLAIALAGQKMEVIRAAKNCADKTETDYAVTLSPDGKAQIKVSKYFYGEDYNGAHKSFAEMPPEERDHYFQEAVSRVAQGARAVSDLTTRFDTYPGLEEFTVELDNYSVVDGNYLYFNLPFVPAFFDTDADQRSLPLFFADENEDITRAEIGLPDGYRLTDIVPQSEKFTTPGGSQVKITQTNADGKFILTDEFTTAPAIIPANSYPALLDIQSALGEKSEKTFLLEKE